MDCLICSVSPSPIKYKPTRGTICGACYEGFRSMVTLMNKYDLNNGKDKTNKIVNSTSGSLQNPMKGVENALKWVKQMKEREEEMIEKLVFLGGLEEALRDQIHTDIQVKPGIGPNRPISAHRALLAARSNIFKNMLDLDDGYMAPTSETLTLPELTYDELDCLLEFLYSGDLPKEKAEKHVYSLSVAADKYEIPYLQRFCENQMLKSMNKSNVLDVLEISDRCLNSSLKEATLNFIVKNMGDVVFSEKFDSFALKNPHMSVEITRALFLDISGNRSRNGV